MANIAISSEAQPVFYDAYLWLRRNMDWIVPILTVGLIIKERAYVTASFASGRWDMPAFYAAVFDWSSIQAAFLFSVFAFFLSRSEPFIQAISNTVPFRALRAYVLKSLILSLGLTLASLPLLISTPVVVSGNYINLGFLLFVGISALLSYTFMCFVKVVRVFYKIEKAS
jgi:hypothetical protein